MNWLSFLLPLFIPKPRRRSRPASKWAAPRKAAAPKRQEITFESEKENLSRKFKEPPSDADVQWSVLVKTRMRHARDSNWGFYTSTTFDMASLLIKEGKNTDAIRHLLEVCYLDLNDPNNLGGSISPDLLKEFPPFSPAPNGLAPGVVSLLAKTIKNAKQPLEKTQAMFATHAAKIEKGLKLPMPQEQAWGIISKALEAREK